MDGTPTKRRKLDHSSGNGSTAISTGLSGSSLALQIGELLKEERVQYETELAGVDELLQKIKASIEGIKPHGSLPIHEASSKIEKKGHVQVPFPDPKPPKDSNYKVTFETPRQFNVVGSYVSKTMARSQKDRGIDMVVVIPEAMLQTKDYLDLRYFYKRSYFLAVIASSLRRELDVDADVSFECLNENPLLPVLALVPKTIQENDNSQQPRRNFRIRVIPCTNSSAFPFHKLYSGASLIRKADDEDERGSQKPTPFYNSTLKAESCFLLYLRLFRQTEKQCPAFTDACILGRIWLQQRGLGGSLSQGGFGAFEWAIFLALLLQRGDSKKNASLSSSLTSTQLFKAMMQLLARTNFAKNPYILGSDSPKEEFLPEAGPVIYDVSRQLNIGFKMSRGSAGLLQQHAKWTHSLLSSTNTDPFALIFITKSNVPLQTFDLVARLRCDDAFEEPPDRQGRAWSFANKVSNVVEKALGDRARLVCVFTPTIDGWSLKTANPSWPSTIEMGILFDAANMARKVDHGPSSEEKEEAKKFREFWGDKSELRRFADGSILETLIWTSTSSSDLCEEIIRYSLRLHLKFGLLEEDLNFYGSKFLSLVPLKHTDAPTFSAAKKAFSSFERDIRDLEGLPLHVRHVAPIAPELRQASVRPPFEVSKSGPQPMEAVLSFEVSGKWPENIAAVQRTKVAFLLKIGSLLEDYKSTLKTYLGLDGAQSDIENLAFLDVVYESGPSFRLRIHSDLEESLLERRTKDKTLDERVRTESGTLLANFRRSYVYLPLMNQTISTFSTRFPALSPTIRLLKYWFNAHKLMCHFNEEFVELVVLRVFSRTSNSAPSSANVGFLQSLVFLAHWDWRAEPLVVDPNGDMSPADHSTVGTRLEAWRKIDPGMNRVALVVATPHDFAHGTSYTTLDGAAKPSKVVATRMTTLARSACKLVKEQGVELQPKALFAPSLKDYDVLIRLNGKILRGTLRTYETDNADGDDMARHSKFKNLDERTGQDPLPLAQHPSVIFLNRLAATYAGTLLLFHGGPDDSIIGGIWNPQMEKRTFKPNLPSSYKPSTKDGEGKVVVNKGAILAEIARIGGDLIDQIEAKAV